MIGTGIDARVQVQQIIENQLPEFLLTENPKAVDFLKQYYISQEHRGGPIDLVDNLDQYVKLVTLTTNSDSTLLRSDIDQGETDIPVSFDLADVIDEK